MKRSLILLTLSFVLFTSGLEAQNRYPNTLLWRISGNGLSKPSYLFGTMHLMDKRLFQFGDSLYSSLENVDGFAAEIEFKEMMDSVFARTIQDETTSLFADEEVKISKNSLDKNSKAILKELQLEVDKLSKKDLKKIREYRVNQFVQKGEMETVVDGYLYGLAMRQGKWLGGIEDVVDQLYLPDEIGGEITTDILLSSEKDLKKSFEWLIDIYLEQDINKIYEYSYSNYDSIERDKVLIVRNLKMARRMDSLSAIRSMFFAVGAAHLPGDSGVIELLKNRGFNVDPIFSNKTIPADEYAKKLNEMPWVKYTDDDNLYTIDLPGIPSNHSVFGSVGKIKMFFDVTTMSFYMILTTVGDLKNTSDLKESFNQVVTNMEGRVEGKINMIEKDGFIAAEGKIHSPSGYYKVKLVQKGHVLFTVMAGGIKPAALSSPIIDKFFSSFHPHEVQSNSNSWSKLTSEEKGFSVYLPGEVKINKSMNKLAEAAHLNLLSYDYVDNFKGLYYLIQVRDLKGGYVLQDDSSFFAIMKEEYQTGGSQVSEANNIIYKGYPALRISGTTEGGLSNFQTMMVVRGNRTYFLIVAGQTEDNLADVDKFFNSLTFHKYGEQVLTNYSMDGFITNTTTPFVKFSNMEDSDADKTQHYYSYNEKTAISLDVIKEVFPKLYWAKSDSAYFYSRATNYKGYEDSVLSQKMLTNGTIKSFEQLIQVKNHSQIKKIRWMVTADTLYTLFAIIPKEYINDSFTLAFFNDFRITHESQPVIYNNNIDSLFLALKSKDSAIFENAYSTYNAVEFNSEDLPVLQKALLHVYRDSTSPYGLYSSIADEVVRLKENSTIEFIRSNFSAIGHEREKLKYELLTVLAKHKSDTAYELLKELLVNGLPKAGDVSGLGYALCDSVQLTLKLFPDVLALGTDSLFIDVLVRVSDFLLDTQAISISELIPYQEAFYRGARNWNSLFQLENGNWWLGTKWLELLGKINTPEANGIIREYLQNDDLYIKKEAIIALLKNELPVPGTEIDKVANDMESRLTFYESLKGINKINLFPKKHATQKSFAESEIYNYAYDEMEVADFEYIDEKRIKLKGVKSTFYLFKVAYKEEDGNLIYHLGVAGPYDLSRKELISYSDLGGIYWTYELDSSDLEGQLKSYIQYMGSYTD